MEKQATQDNFTPRGILWTLHELPTDHFVFPRTINFRHIRFANNTKFNKSESISTQILTEIKLGKILEGG